MRKWTLFRKASKSFKEISCVVNSEKKNFENVVRVLSAENPASTLSLLTEILGRLAAVEKETRGYENDLPGMWEKAFGNPTIKELLAAYSDDNIELYRRIDKKLFTIEKEMKKDFERLSGHCRSLLDDGAIEDFEIEAKIFFYLDENDPDYMDADDNILGSLTFRGKNMLATFFGLGDGSNHNIFQIFPDHPLRNEHHCYLFRCLYHRTDLDWNEVRRIGRVWVDINVKYQKSYPIMDPTTTELES